MLIDETAHDIDTNAMMTRDLRRLPLGVMLFANLSLLAWTQFSTIRASAETFGS
jgi:hypothetical protein